jgi:hypothetical protein
MKKQVIVAVAMVLCSIAFGAVEGVAQQIFNQFRQPELVVGRPYRDLDACDSSRLKKNILPPSSFVLPPTNSVDLDAGYSYVAFPQGVRFNFNGRTFNGIYVSVNGFATFDGTKLVPANQSSGLFINSSSYPDNVVAPFWGDHRIRENQNTAAGYMPSEVSWAYDTDRDENCQPINSGRKCIIIQWKNLNINDQSVNSSVGNFQARLYVGDQSTNFQGDIEFAYGQIGGNPYTTNTVVVTRGATVGIKGTGGFPGFISDFWNGLIWAPQAGANRRTDSTTIWQPSNGRSDAVIRFGSIVYLTFDMWGYGDADTSAAAGQRHANLDQNRRVTSNDARVIMRSIVMNKPLDSVWKRQAYQGDVNHSGRYYFSKLKRDFSGDSLDANNQIVIWRRTIDVDQFTGKQVLRVMHESQGLYGVGGRAPDLSSLNQIYYEVTEYDAGLIMRYLSGRLPYLPWIYDNDTTGPDFGKVGDVDFADNVNFGAPVSIGNGLVRVPVYLNGIVEGAFGIRFNTSSDIAEVTAVNSEFGSAGVDHSDRIAVVVGSGSFGPSSPIAFVTMKEQESYDIIGIRFNEVSQGNVRLAGLEDEAANAVTAYPNPMTSETSFAVTVPTSSTVTVTIHDVFGKVVNTIFNGDAAAGTMSLAWNGVDAAGARVAAGTYIVRVAGDNFSTTTKLTVAR